MRVIRLAAQQLQYAATEQNCGAYLRFDFVVPAFFEGNDSGVPTGVSIGSHDD